MGARFGTCCFFVVARIEKSGPAMEELSTTRLINIYEIVESLSWRYLRPDVSKNDKPIKILSEVIS